MNRRGFLMGMLAAALGIAAASLPKAQERQTASFSGVTEETESHNVRIWIDGKELEGIHSFELEWELKPFFIEPTTTSVEYTGFQEFVRP